MATPLPQQNSEATSTSQTMPYLGGHDAEQSNVVVRRTPYIPQLVDLYAVTDSQRWTVNDFIEVMRNDEYPPMLFNEVYNETLQDLKLVTQQSHLENIGPKNQVHYIIQRIWAKIAHIVLTRRPMGAVCIGEDSPYHDDSNLINSHMWHIFQLVGPSTSLLMDRVHAVVSQRAYDLRLKLTDFRMGMHIISTYKEDGMISTLMTVGKIDIDMYTINTQHKCPFCRTQLQLDLLKFEEEVEQDIPKVGAGEAAHHTCCLQGSQLCIDTKVAVGHLPCEKCNPENTRICRFCMQAVIMQRRY